MHCYYGVNLTKAISLILLALILASVAGYLSVAMSTTMAPSISKTEFEMKEKTLGQVLVARPPLLILRGDPINDPKPNSR